MGNSIQPEIHLFILWENARIKEKEIIEDIGKHLRILECIDIGWSRSKVKENFSRFYGYPQKQKSGKENECGYGRFLLITVLDEQPRYELARTLRGFSYVNTNILSLKEKYRDWTGNGFLIHSSTTAREANHDLTLLLGINTFDYTKRVTQNRTTGWGRRRLDCDLIGAYGWESLAQLFYVLNATIRYIVMRNHESLSDIFEPKTHGDIDIVSENENTLFLLLNGIEKEKTHQQLVPVGNKQIYFHSYYPEDGYYCKPWAKEMLECRKLANNGVYINNDENYFYSLIYHAIYHRRTIPEKYYDIVASFYQRLGMDIHHGPIVGVRYPFDNYYQLLKGFMEARNYWVSVPLRDTIGFNFQAYSLVEIQDKLTKQFFYKNCRPYGLNCFGDQRYLYFEALFNDQKVLIKYGAPEKAFEREYDMSRYLYSKNARNMICALHYSNFQDCGFISFLGSFVTSLHQMMKEVKLTDEEIIKILQQFVDILTTLTENKCLHRNISPKSLLLTETGDVVLTDYDCMLSLYSGTIEDVKEDLQRSPTVGSEYAPGPFSQDDAFSITQIALILKKKMCDPKLAEPYLDLLYRRIGLNSISLTRWSTYKHRKKILRILSSIVPVRSWRHRIRKI